MLPSARHELRHRDFWQTTWKFPVPTNYSLFRRRKFPDTTRTGNLTQALQILGDFASVIDKITLNRHKFVKIPCYFPCYQGIHDLLGDARTPQSGAAVVHFTSAVAGLSASETREQHRRIDREVPDFAEFIIGPAEGRTRWLNRV